MNPGSVKAVPTSCCVTGTTNLDQCQLFNDGSSGQPPLRNLSLATADNLSLNEHGCIDELKDKIEEYIVAVAAVSVVVLIVMFLCVVFSVYVCMHVSRKNMVV